MSSSQTSTTSSPCVAGDISSQVPSPTNINHSYQNKKRPLDCDTNDENESPEKRMRFHRDDEEQQRRPTQPSHTTSQSTYHLAAHYQSICLEYKAFVEKMIVYLNVPPELYDDFKSQSDTIAAKLQMQPLDQSLLVSTNNLCDSCNSKSNSCVMTTEQQSQLQKQQQQPEHGNQSSVQQQNTQPQQEIQKQQQHQKQQQESLNIPSPHIDPSRNIFDNSAVPFFESNNSTTTTTSDGISDADSYDILSVLRDIFFLSDFRPCQEDIIRAVLCQKDVVVIQATGSGKSLCYQLPAVCENKLTIVISPLISLIHDQVAYLKSLDIRCTYLTSTHNDPHIINEILANEYQIVYITPERLIQSGVFSKTMKSLYERKLLNRIVIDEAHCISKWGHEFRKDYRGLGIIRKEYPSVPIMALTATASPQVQTDIIHSLQMNPIVFKSSFNRKNLFYEVRYKGTFNETLRDMSDFIKTKHANNCGIIYCHSKKETEKISKHLNKLGHSTAVYHADISPQQKQKNHDDWRTGKIKTIVATVAFGMGIDKPDVRYILHSSMTRSIEDYYQATGRAGRDGEPSDCILYFANGDRTRNYVMLQKKLQTEENQARKQRAQDSLNQMVAYCETTNCRRHFLLNYFCEDFSVSDCQNTCDNCRNKSIPVKEVDITKDARNLLTVIKQIDGRCTLNQCISVWRGSKTRFIVDKLFDKLEGHGTGRHMSRDEASRIAHVLLQQGLVAEKSKQMGFYAVAILTVKGEAFLEGSEESPNPIVITTRERTSQKTRSRRTTTTKRSSPSSQSVPNASSADSPDPSDHSEDDDEEDDTEELDEFNFDNMPDILTMEDQQQIDYQSTVDYLSLGLEIARSTSITPSPTRRMTNKKSRRVSPRRRTRRNVNYSEVNDSEDEDWYRYGPDVDVDYMGRGPNPPARIQMVHHTSCSDEEEEITEVVIDDDSEEEYDFSYSQ